MFFLWGLLEDVAMKPVFSWLKRSNADLVFVNHAAIDQTRIDPALMEFTSERA